MIHEPGFARTPTEEEKASSGMVSVVQEKRESSQSAHSSLGAPLSASMHLTLSMTVRFSLSTFPELQFRISSPNQMQAHHANQASKTNQITMMKSHHAAPLYETHHDDEAFFGINGSNDKSILWTSPPIKTDADDGVSFFYQSMTMTTPSRNDVHAGSMFNQRQAYDTASAEAMFNQEQEYDTAHTGAKFKKEQANDTAIAELR
jgi:hypothetical protein